MFVTKCDICKREIKRGDRRVTAGLDWLDRKELCFNCGKPVIKFLLQKKLVTKDEVKKSSGR